MEASCTESLFVDGGALSESGVKDGSVLDAVVVMTEDSLTPNNNV